jgi:hypothetical protein
MRLVDIEKYFSENEPIDNIKVEGCSTVSDSKKFVRVSISFIKNTDILRKWRQPYFNRLLDYYLKCKENDRS